MPCSWPGWRRWGSWRGADAPERCDARIGRSAQAKGELRFAFFASRAGGASRTIAADAGLSSHRHDRAHTRPLGRGRRLHPRFAGRDGRRRALAMRRRWSSIARSRRPAATAGSRVRPRSRRSPCRTTGPIHGRATTAASGTGPASVSAAAPFPTTCSPSTSSAPAATCKSISMARSSTAAGGCRSR